MNINLLSNDLPPRVFDFINLAVELIDNDICTCMLSCFSYVPLFVTPWIVAHQDPLSMGFSKQEYWSGLPCSPPGDLPNPGIKPMSPVLASGVFTTVTSGKPTNTSQL